MNKKEKNDIELQMARQSYINNMEQQLEMMKNQAELEKLNENKKTQIKKYNKDSMNIQEINNIELQRAKDSYNRYCEHCKQSVGHATANIYVEETKEKQRWTFNWGLFFLLFLITLTLGSIVYLILYFTIGKQKVIYTETVSKSVNICPICKSTF